MLGAISISKHHRKLRNQDCYDCIYGHDDKFAYDEVICRKGLNSVRGFVRSWRGKYCILFEKRM